MFRKLLGIALVSTLAVTAVAIPAGANASGTEGCTPGYWKNHIQSWVGYSPTTLVKEVFIAADGHPIGDMTLLQALGGGGGSGFDGAARILLRAGIAALLNASSSIDYPGDVNSIIDRINAALTGANRSQMLRLADNYDAKNNLGCPLNGRELLPV
jgi:hypothetical protein